MTTIVCPTCVGINEVPMGFYVGEHPAALLQRESCRTCEGHGVVCIGPLCFDPAGPPELDQCEGCLYVGPLLPHPCR